MKEVANKKNSSEEERVSHIDVINASIPSSLSEWRREQSRDSYCRMAFDKIMAANTRHANRGGTTELGKRGERSPSIEEINSEGKEINREEIEGMEWTSKALQHTAYEKKLIPKGDFSNISQHNVGQKKGEFKMESTTIKAPGEGERKRVHFLSDGTKGKETTKT